MRRKGHVFVISAPSGSGKTTVAARALKKLKNIYPSVALTTRHPRKGEKDKRDYRYVSKKVFKKAAQRHELLEWAANYGHYYGTPKKFVLEKTKQGSDVLLRIDVKGAMQVKKKIPQSVLVFLKPPSLAELKRRLVSRNTDGKKEISKRLKIAKKELLFMPKYDYVVVNRKLPQAAREVALIIKKERRR